MHEPNDLTQLLREYPGYKILIEGAIRLLVGSEGEIDYGRKLIITTDKTEIPFTTPLCSFERRNWEDSTFKTLIPETQAQTLYEYGEVGELFLTIQKNLFKLIASEFYLKTAADEKANLALQYAVENFLIHSSKQCLNAIAENLHIPPHHKAEGIETARFVVQTPAQLNNESIYLVRLYVEYALRNNRYSVNIKQQSDNLVELVFLYHDSDQKVALLQKVLDNPATYNNILRYTLKECPASQGQRADIPSSLGLIDMIKLRDKFTWDIKNLVDALQYAHTNQSHSFTPKFLYLLLLRWKVAELAAKELFVVEETKQILDTRTLRPFSALPDVISKWMTDISAKGGIKIFYNQICPIPEAAIKKYNTALTIIQKAIGEEQTQRWIKEIIKKQLGSSENLERNKNALEIKLGMAIYLAKTDPRSADTIFDILRSIKISSIKSELTNPWFKQRYFAFLSKMISHLTDIGQENRNIFNRLWEMIFTYVPKTHFLTYPASYYNPRPLTNDDISKGLHIAATALSSHNHTEPIDRHVKYYPGWQPAANMQAFLNLFRGSPVRAVPGTDPTSLGP